MGDLFNQRRAAKRQQPPTSSGRPSLLDIQAEQEQNRSNHNRSYGGRGERTRSSGGRQRRDRNNYSDNLPTEQGEIISLKEGFGFIRCADRPEELFFHYSQVVKCHPDDLQMSDEVEFRVEPSRKDNDKLAAVGVNRLEPGTIEWETEDEPGVRFQGLVERSPRTEGRGASSQTFGTIRMLVAPSSAEAEPDATETQEEPQQQGEIAAEATGPLVQFSMADVLPPKEDEEAAEETSGRFRRMDSSHSRGGGSRLGRNDLVEFTLVTERRSGTKLARSIALLQSERERQRLEKEKKLLENATLERGIVTTLKNDFGFLRSNRRREEVYFHYSNVELPDEDDDEEGDLVLKEGQEMEFLVVTEAGGNGRKGKTSARKVQFLPAGSVIFHSVLAEGITGVVTRCPHPTDSGYSSELVGTVRLSVEVEDKDADTEASTLVKDALLYAADSPGGSYQANRDGSSVGMWIREGDTLLFDLVKEIVDNSYRVAPTKYLEPLPALTSSASEMEKTPATSETKAVHIVSAALAGRAEGVVHTIKDNFGFIHCAERPVDTYFRLYEVMPNDMQETLRRNMPGIDHGKEDEDWQLKVGAEVQFDLALQGTIAMGNTRSSRHRHGQSSDRENLKAQRLLLLPPGSVVETKVIAKGVKGTVSKEDPRQPYAGLIELEETQTPMSPEERHPLVAKLIKSMLESDTEAVVFHDVQSAKEDEVVVNMVETLGKGALTHTHLPMAGMSSQSGRLRISKKQPSDADETVEQVATETPEDQTEGSPKKERRKKKQHKEKPIKVIRYDKHCLVKEVQEDMPPGKGDIVECDVVQSRRTGMVGLANIRLVERSTKEAGDEGGAQSGVGIVSEVVASRQFGFISLVDENATKREMLFFHLSSIVNTQDSDGAASRNKQGGNHTVRKGDEVKFDIVIGKNGKRTAVGIALLPRGTLDINTKADKNACRGYILMEPSHTTLSNTPSRQSSTGSNAPEPPSGTGGRWQNVDTNLIPKQKSATAVKEEGHILLTNDPTNMFGVKLDGGSKASDDTGEKAESNNDDKTPSALGTHLPYKPGAIAIHGPGSSSVTDSTSAPRRGDLVSFVKAKSGKGVRDVRVVTRGAATLVRGRLEGISRTDDETASGTARFCAATEKEEVYDINLSEIVSCDVSRLKDKESVEGILHDGKIFGVCRTCDLYLESKSRHGEGPGGHKERPRLNLTLRKKDGKIMAQSSMAKGPDGTNGFANGWTKRVSQYHVPEAPKPAAETELDIEAAPFVPSNET